jgi:hypothetical protein
MKFLFYFVITFFLANCGEKSKHKKLQKKLSFGKYIENTSDTTLLFKGELVLTNDSLFKYKSLGVFQDTAFGSFTLSGDRIIFMYFDEYSESSFKMYDTSIHPFPIELLGLRVTLEGRPLQLVFKKDTLFYTDVDRKRALEKGLYYLLQQ